MDRDARIVKLKLDVIFKRIFGDAENEDIIAAFLSDLLEIDRSSIKSITIENVELTPEFYEQKFSRLDLKMNLEDRIVNVEMQVNGDEDFRERTLFYWSRLYGGQLKSGDEYGQLMQTICINIINFNLFDCEDYHSHFKVLECRRLEPLTDRLAIHFFELRKIGKYQKKKRMEEWLKLIDAETEGDLMDIQQTTGIPEIKKTIVKLRELSADDKVRQEAEYREKRLHDEASALGNAERRGEKRGLEKGVKIGRAEERAKAKRAMEKMGFSDEQIRLVLERMSEDNGE